MQARRNAVVVEAVRTPIGKQGGILKGVRPDDLAAIVMKELVKRTRIEPSQIDDVYFGCANQAGEDNRNVARMSLLLAGLPYSVPGATVNRLCASGLEAINEAARVVWAEEGDIVIAGGVESMTRAPLVTLKPEISGGSNIPLADTTIGWRFVNLRWNELGYPPISMGETAENLAEKYHVSRAAQDEFALWSHKKAVAAIDGGRFKDEVVTVPTPQKPAGESTDEGPRRDTSLEKLASLQPSFRKGGTVTAGNASMINDGAAALLLMEEETARKLSLRPLARVIGSATVGVHPSFMGIGPVYATKKLLARTGMTMSDFGVVEVNEAFAAQVLACVAEMPEFDLKKINPNGGAIALGHPIGCSGARIAATLLHEMSRTRTEYGLATMCVGVGQGVATAFELLPKG